MKRSLLKIIGAVLATVMALSAVYALNMDQSRNFPARVLTTQQVSYYRVVVNFNDANISTAQKFGALPKNAFITNVEVEVVTAFNAGTTNNLSFGTSTTATEIVAVADLAGGGGSSISTGVTRVTRGFGRGLTSAGDTTLYAKYTQTGAAATTGQAIIVITFIPDNDM